MSDAQRSSGGREYLFFLGGLGSWFGAWGMQNVMFQWLVVEELGASASRVGGAQMALLLPSLLFMLVGGAIADRIDRRRTLMLLHAAGALPMLGLAWLVSAGALTYPVVVGYAVVMGTFQAFVLPIRDAQLGDIVKTRMSRAVAGLTMVQHGGQGLGSLLSGLASLAGAAPVLALQALVMLSGALPTQRLRPIARPPAAERPRFHLRDIGPGLTEVARSPILRAVMLLNMSVGLVFVGTYLVLLPLLVRDLYGGGAPKMGVLAGVLPLGSIIMNLVIVARGGVARQGLSLLLGQGFAGLSLGGLAFGLPFWASAGCVFGWGLGAAFAINASRTLFQVHASEANRGRVLSVYTIAIIGTGPLGALVSGVLAEAFGPLTTLGIHSVTMTTIIAGALLFSRVRSFR